MDGFRNWAQFLVLVVLTQSSVFSTKAKPNFVIFLVDDVGYGDLAAYGNTDQESGPLEQMAAEGIKFTQWTSPGFVCTPSRSALMTGRYPRRSGIYGNDSAVFSPSSSGGLPYSEITIAEALKTRGYATGLVGKWHLGINRYTSTDGLNLPQNHGFDWVGTNLPHGQSNGCGSDTTTGGAGRGNRRGGTSSRRQSEDSETSSSSRGNNARGGRRGGGRGRRRTKRQANANQNSACFLYDGASIVEQPINTKNLTSKLVNDAVDFIRSSKDKPFFLYVGLPQAHPTWFCNDDFCGKSKRGEYGDVLNEMSWAVGRVLAELKAQGVDKDTLSIFSSDHGARRSNCRSEWSNGPFRDGKGTTWEGGIRVPTIARWPGKLTPNYVTNTLTSHLDIFPTLLHLAGASDYLASLTRQGIYTDGRLVPELVTASGTVVSPRSILFYYCSDRIMAVRINNYKIHYHTMGKFEQATGGCRGATGDYSCYDGEDIVDHNPPLVIDLTKSQDESLAEDNNSPTTRSMVALAGALVRAHESTFVNTPSSQLDLPSNPSLKPCCNPPLCSCP